MAARRRGASGNRARTNTVATAASDGSELSVHAQLQASQAAHAEASAQLEQALSTLRESQLRRHEAEAELEATRRRLDEAVAARAEADKARQEVVSGVAGKAAQAAAIESALVDLLVELMRRDEGVESALSYDEHRELAVQRSGGDPLVLLDMLRSTLRVQVRTAGTPRSRARLSSLPTRAPPPPHQAQHVPLSHPMCAVTLL